MNVEFIASVSVVTPDPARSRKLFVETLGLPLHHDEGDDYYATEELSGSKHFSVWPLAQAAQACFGTAEWPNDRPVPQVSIEFELADEQAVKDGARELEQRGFRLLHPVRTEPWGQTVARILTAEGAIIGLSYAPSLHDKRKAGSRSGND
jgi:catechol 2,3-dioxygenase-like lactoylglutathione lyase family enzyme